MLILITCLYFQQRTKPFINHHLNVIELRSLLVASVTIYCGLFFITNRIGMIAEVLMFVLMVIVNLAFLGTWLQSTAKFSILSLYKKARCFRRLVKQAGLKSWFYKQLCSEAQGQCAKVLPDISTFAFTAHEVLNVTRNQSVRESCQSSSSSSSSSSEIDSGRIYVDAVEEAIEEAVEVVEYSVPSSSRSQCEAQEFSRRKSSTEISNALDSAK
jgi:hypothetical protein